MWQGDAIADDFIQVLTVYQNDIQTKSDYIYYDEIVNLTNMTRNKLFVKGLIKIGKVASRTDQLRIKTKLAFVVNSDLLLNFIKLYTTYRNFGKKNKKKIRAFISESDAADWILNSR